MQGATILTSPHCGGGPNEVRPPRPPFTRDPPHCSPQARQPRGALSAAGYTWPGEEVEILFWNSPMIAARYSASDV